MLVRQSSDSIDDVVGRRSLTAKIDAETRQAGFGGTSAVARRWFPIAPWRLSLQNTG